MRVSVASTSASSRFVETSWSSSASHAAACDGSSGIEPAAVASTRTTSMRATRSVRSVPALAGSCTTSGPDPGTTWTSVAAGSSVNVATGCRACLRVGAERGEQIGIGDRPHGRRQHGAATEPGTELAASHAQLGHDRHARRCRSSPGPRSHLDRASGSLGARSCPAASIRRRGRCGTPASCRGSPRCPPRVRRSRPARRSAGRTRAAPAGASRRGR